MEEYFSRENEDPGSLPKRDIWREIWYDTKQPTAAGVLVLLLVFVVR